MYWAQYVLVDQALRSGGMRSTECPSRFYIFAFMDAFRKHTYIYIHNEIMNTNNEEEE